MTTHERALVLAHPDLAEQLTKPPLNFSRPEAWDGYIPPETWGETARGHPRFNDSPRRIALLALVAEARRREETRHAPVIPIPAKPSTRQEQP